MNRSMSLLFVVFLNRAVAIRLGGSSEQGYLRTTPYTPPSSCPKDIIPPIVANSSSSPDMDTFGNSIFRYRCNYGYVASNRTNDAASPQEFTARCEPTGPGGALQVEVKSGCTIGYCNMTSLVGLRNSHISPSPASNATVGTVVSLNCATGFSIDGSANGPRSRQYTCQPDISWSPVISDPDCSPVSCGAVQPFPNAVITSGQRLSQKVFYNTTITYQCAPGYIFRPPMGSPSTSSSFSMVCSDSGSMVPKDHPDSVSPGSCVPLTCASPAPTFAKADLVGSPSDSIELGTQIQYVCKMGTFFNNNTDTIPIGRSSSSISSFKTTCIQNSDGSMGFDTNPNSAGCYAEPCVNPPIPPSTARFANNTPTQFFVGDTVRYVCADGYLYRGVPVPVGSPQPTIDATCNDDKNWVLDEGAFSVCIPGQCDSLAAVPPDLLQNVNTKLLGSPTDHMALGAKLEMECEDGFYSAKNSSTLVLSCNQEGQFEVSGKCVRRCGPLPVVPENAVATVSDGSPYQSGESLLASVVVKFTCKSGYSLDGKQVSSGVNNTVQSFKCSSIPGIAEFDPPPSSATCVRISCGYPPSRANAQWVLNSPHQDYKSGDIVKYTCADGMGVFGNNGKVVSTSYDYRCTDSGWESDDATRNECKKITCSANPVIGNGSLSGPFTETVSVGDVVGVECQYGFEAAELKNKAGITCTNSGDYSPSNYATDMCKPVQCPTLPSTILGASKVGDKSDLRFGEAPVMYSCDPSWGLPMIQVKCLQDKTYQVDGEQCVEPTCGTTVASGMMNVAPMTNATSSIGTVANARCQNGFTAKDNSVQFQVKCATGAQWAPVDASYKDGCPLSTETTEAVLIR